MLPSVLSRCCICCSGHTHILQVYVLNVSSVFRHILQQMLHVASVSWVGAGSGRRRSRWSPPTQRPPHAREKRSEHGGPHVHVQQQAHVFRSNRKASSAGVTAAVWDQAQQHRVGGRGQEVHAYTSVLSPIESHGCRVVSVNVMLDGFGPHVHYCYQTCLMLSFGGGQQAWASRCDIPSVHPGISHSLCFSRHSIVFTPSIVHSTLYDILVFLDALVFYVFRY
jgi:hypothetical protein